MRLGFILLVLSVWSSMGLACEHSVTEFQCVEYVRNYDGDTITVNIPNVHPLLGEEITVRVAGIDSPEMTAQDQCEKRQAIRAKERVRELMASSGRITLTHIQRDKYFRILADVFADDVNIAQDLLGRGLAVPYDGGHKERVDWCEFNGGFTFF